jgi:ribosomal protein S18 acetylase RimI-like enzyme
MLMIEELLREKGVESIRLDAFSLNPVALGMYNRLGYKKVGEVIWRKGLFYLFEKKLSPE